MIPTGLRLLLAAALLASCAQAPEALPSDVQVVVDMKEYSVTVSVTTVKAGSVKFGVRNVGTMEHSFELIRTELAVDKLPVDTGSAKVKEDGLVRQVKSLSPGRVATLTLDLAAGKYVILCNVAGHYQLGMRAAFTVE